MQNKPDDLLERATWYRLKAENARRTGDDAPLASMRDSYRNMAKTFDARAAEAEEAYRLQNTTKRG